MCDCADVEGPPRSQALTVTVWLKCAARASADADVIISGGTATNGWRLFREPRFNYLSLDFWGPNWGGGGGGGPVVADGRWHHYALAMVGGASQVFVDGEPKGSGGGAPVAAPLRLTPMRIGGQARLNAYFSGCLDDLRVYDEALSQSQIVAIMTPPPVLRIAWQGDQLLVSWPTRAGDFLLEACTGLPSRPPGSPLRARRSAVTTPGKPPWTMPRRRASSACVRGERSRPEKRRRWLRSTRPAGLGRDHRPLSTWKTDTTRGFPGSGTSASRRWNDAPCAKIASVLLTSHAGTSCTGPSGWHDLCPWTP